LIETIHKQKSDLNIDYQIRQLLKEILIKLLMVLSHEKALSDLEEKLNKKLLIFELFIYFLKLFI